MVQVVGIFGIIVIAVISVISVTDMLIDGLNQAYKDDNNRKFVRGWVAVFGFAIIVATLTCLAIQRNNAQEAITELTKQVEAIETAETTDTQNYDYIIPSYSHTIYTNAEGKQFVIFYHYGYYYEYPDNGKIDSWNDYILQMNDNDTPDNFIDDSWSVLAVFAMIPLFIGLMVASEATFVKTYNTYEVIIDETVNFTEFMQTYDLIEQRGEIYVIKEKGTP